MRKIKTYDFTKRNDITKKIENVGNMKLNSVNEQKAELFFYGDIVSNTWQSYWYEEDKSPQDVVDFFEDFGKYKDVDIFINSGGGSVHGGLAIYNILKRHKGYKTVYVDALAASIASVIALAGDKIVIPSNAQFMIHKPWSYIIGDADEMRKEADALDSCQKAILSVYMQHTKEGITEDIITEMINKETWLTGDEAKQYFDIEAIENTDIVNCKSDYYEKYKNIPFNYKESELKKEKELNLLQLQLDLLKL